LKRAFAHAETPAVAVPSVRLGPDTPRPPCGPAALIRDHTGWDLKNVPGWCLKVTHATDLRVPLWWRQCAEQAAGAGALPLLVYRVPRRGWVFRWPVAVLLRVQSAGMWHGVEWSVESGVEAWAAVARDLITEEQSEGLRSVNGHQSSCVGAGVGKT
jgi:hypothetical protein